VVLTSSSPGASEAAGPAGRSGVLWAWGDNAFGQLGDGSTTNSQVPVPVSVLRGATAIAAGDHGLALQPNGTVWAWGTNNYGQVGDGTVIDRLTPVQVVGLSDVTAIVAGGSHSLALRSDGTVWAWGVNDSGELGASTTQTCNSIPCSMTPIQVSGLTGVIGIAAGVVHSLAWKADGTVWAWGNNSFGQLGDGTTTQRATPIEVPGLSGVGSVAGGGLHTLAVKRDGTVLAWGANGYGQLGDGTTTDRHTPVRVVGLGVASAVSGGLSISLALKPDGTVWAWGLNVYGQLGSPTVQTCYVQRYPCSSTPLEVSGLAGVIAISTEWEHSLALKANRTVWAWGLNASGELGDNSTTNHLRPVRVTAMTGATAIAAGYDFSLGRTR
jgi:alpha-tubulin suppressor-like RCC1 family protein